MPSLTNHLNTTYVLESGETRQGIMLWLHCCHFLSSDLFQLIGILIRKYPHQNTFTASAFSWLFCGTQKKCSTLWVLHFRKLLFCSQCPYAHHCPLPQDPHQLIV